MYRAQAVNGRTWLIDRLQSKWGQLGLFEHDLFEVPSDYGRIVRYFKRVPFAEAIEVLHVFAKETDSEFEEHAH